MMDMAIALGIVSAMGLSHALFLSIYLWLAKSQNRLADRLLSLLLLVLAIRISKSVFFTIFGYAPELYLKSALVFMALVGPVLYFYTWSINSRNSGRLSFQTLAIHSIPAILVTGIFYTTDDIFTKYSYLAVNIHFGVYITITAMKYGRLENSSTTEWVRIVLFSISAIWIFFLIQYLRLSIGMYEIASILSGLALFVISLVASLRFRLLKKIHANGLARIPLSEGEVREVVGKLKILMGEEQIYRDTELTLPRLSRRLEIPTHHLSWIVNQGFSMSFPEVLNFYRVEFVKNQLLDGHNNHKKIEAIAFEAGFHSLSNFYTTFKKLSRMTPDQYRKKTRNTVGV